MFFTDFIGGTMDGIQITAAKKLSTVTKKEDFSSIESTKVIITKAMLIREDFNAYLGNEKIQYPIIPARIGIGKISAVSDEENQTLVRGMRVFPHLHNCYAGVCSS